MMNRLKKMDKKVDNIMRIMRKVMKGGKYSNGMFRISLHTKQFVRPKEINEKLMKCRNEILLLFIAYFRGWIIKLANSTLR